jgi:hypothetical protein
MPNHHANRKRKAWFHWPLVAVLAAISCQSSQPSPGMDASARDGRADLFVPPGTDSGPAEATAPQPGPEAGGRGDTSPSDSEPSLERRDAASIDESPVDSVQPDLARWEARGADASPADAAQPDQGRWDVAGVELSPVDAAQPDLARLDLAGVDASPADAAQPDQGRWDAPDVDALAVDSAAPDGALPDGPGDRDADNRCPILLADDVRNPIVQGVTTVQFPMLMSRLSVTEPDWVPLVWASARASGGDWLGLPGTLPVPGWAKAWGCGRIAVWAGHEGAFAKEGDGVAQNDKFRENLLGWLLGTGTRLGCTSTHSEWFGCNSFSPVLSSWLTARGVTPAAVDRSLGASSLAGWDVVVVGNPWADLSDSEIAALDDWVRAGGSLLVLGLGWSWASNHQDPKNLAYPVNRLGARFGFRVEPGYIVDPGATTGTASQPGFTVQPLSEYHPKTIEVLRSSEVDVNQIKTLGPASPDKLYVIEGIHVGLNLASNDWASLVDPVAALAALDKIYAAELALAGNVKPPFGGDKVWAVAADDPDGAYWMHAGNPIVFKQEAGQAEIIRWLNADGQPGWGLGHEQGHNMASDSCGNLFVPDGTTEVWCNVFNVYSYLHNGWSWTEQMGDLFTKGHAFHAQANPDFNALLADPFVMLGCLELIWSKYGWGGMQTFFTKAATDSAAGLTASDSAARTAYMVEQLSAAYQLDLAPLFVHWGFTVSAASLAATGRYPDANIPW